MAPIPRSGMIRAIIDRGVGLLELGFRPALALNGHQQIFLCHIWRIYPRMKTQEKALAQSVVKRLLRMMPDHLKSSNRQNIPVLKEAKGTVNRKESKENGLHLFGEVVVNLLYPPTTLLLAMCRILSRLMIRMNGDEHFLPSFAGLYNLLVLGN